MIQEYERAVIFRLGRIAKGGARGPGKMCTHIFLRVSEAELSMTSNIEIDLKLIKSLDIDF